MTAVLIAGSLYLLYRWVDEDLSLLKQNRAQHENFLAVQEELRTLGMTSPDQVFSNKYDLYTPDLPPYLPRQIGGWAIDWVWGYGAEYPVLPNDSWESFSQAAAEQGVRFLVLTPASELQGAFFSLIYDRAYDEDVLGLYFAKRIAMMRLYYFYP